MYLVQKNKAGVWYIVDTETGADGKKKKIWRSTKTTERQEAEAILKEIEASRSLLGQHQTRRNIKDLIVERALAASAVLVQQKTTFQEAWQIYLNDPRTRGMKESSYRRVLACWNRFASYAESRFSHVEQITYDDAIQYIERIRGDLSSGTVLLHKTALHGIFSRIRRPLGLSDNPFDDMYVQRPQRRTHRCFTQEEIGKIFAALPPDGEWYGVSAVSLYTGMRFGDCCTLRAEEIKDGFICRGVRKLARYGTEQVTAIHPDLLPILEERKRQHPSGFLFPKLASSYRGYGPARFFGTLLRSLNIRDDNYVVDFHSFRHTFNTLLIEGGVDLGVRLRLTGHSNVNTNQIYNHANQALTSAINRIPSLLNKEQEDQR